MERYSYVRDLGSGNFGVAKLMVDRLSGEHVAVKFLPRGQKLSPNVEREILNHHSLRHPNIVGFKEVFLTDAHLGIAMEYASGGELFDRIIQTGRLTEEEARFFFQQLIMGVAYIHNAGLCHRDLKLENTLLDGSPAPILKICDFGYSKTMQYNSQPKSTVGTPAYIAPEVLSSRQYNGRMADVWSCGVTLFVMLVGAYPFEDPREPRNFRSTVQRIVSVQYSFPPHVEVSPACRDLLARIFVVNPQHRITIQGIMQLPWFQTDLPDELRDGYAHMARYEPSLQTREEIHAILEAASQKCDAPAAAGEGEAKHTDRAPDYA